MRTVKLKRKKTSPSKKVLYIIGGILLMWGVISFIRFKYQKKYNGKISDLGYYREKRQGGEYSPQDISGKRLFFFLTKGW